MPMMFGTRIKSQPMRAELTKHWMLSVPHQRYTVAN